MSSIAGERLALTYDSRHGPVEALAGVDLEAADGELVALVGPSGCGKSTLLRLLAGLLAPSAGRVLLDGSEPERLLGRVALMPQRDLLLPWRSVEANAALPLELAGVPRASARARVREELPRFGLDGYGHRWPAALSGGMRQRAALLRSLIARPQVLLLDEPFAALDALTRETTRAWLLDVWEAERAAVVLVTHDVEEAIFLADRVLVMSARPGRVVASFDTDLPRPRSLDLVTTDAFVERKRAVLATLRAQR